MFSEITFDIYEVNRKSIQTSTNFYFSSTQRFTVCIIIIQIVIHKKVHRVPFIFYCIFKLVEKKERRRKRSIALFRSSEWAHTHIHTRPIHFEFRFSFHSVILSMRNDTSDISSRAVCPIKCGHYIRLEYLQALIYRLDFFFSLYLCRDLAVCFFQCLNFNASRPWERKRDREITHGHGTSEYRSVIDARTKLFDHKKGQTKNDNA